LLTASEARALWQVPNAATLKGKRNRALLAMLLGCGLRRRELTQLLIENMQRREDHWAIVDLVGKGGHVRTVPIPDWVKTTIDAWVAAAGINSGRLFRCVCRADKVWGEDRTPPGSSQLSSSLRTIFDAPVRGCATPLAGNWIKFNSS
jgi:integrase